MKTKNHFDSEIDNASQSINTDSKEDRNALSHKNQEEDDASNDVLNPIDPNSTEGRVNERIKIKNLILFLVKVLQEVKF